MVVGIAWQMEVPTEAGGTELVSGSISAEHAFVSYSEDYKRVFVSADEDLGVRLASLATTGEADRVQASRPAAERLAAVLDMRDHPRGRVDALEAGEKALLRSDEEDPHSDLLRLTPEWTQRSPRRRVMGFPNLAGTRDDGAGGTDCVEARCPASTLTWCEAVEYANRLSKREGRQECMTLVNARGSLGTDFSRDGVTPSDTTYYQCGGYRLPTAGEWEYATRAGTTTAFFSGPWTKESPECFDMTHMNPGAWYCHNSGAHSHPVCTRCTREPNPWGLFDLLGKRV